MEKKPSLAGRLVSTTSKETRIANLSRYFIFENQSWYVQLINRCWSIHKLTFYCLGNHNWSKLSQVRNWFDQSLTFQLYCTYLQNATLRKKKTPKAQNRTAASFYSFTYAQQDSERPSNAAKTLSWIFFEARKQYFATVTTTGADNKASQSGCVFVVTLSWSLEIRSGMWDLISGINHHLWSSCLLDQNSVIDKNLHAPNLSRSRSLILKQKKLSCLTLMKNEW